MRRISLSPSISVWQWQQREALAVRPPENTEGKEECRNAERERKEEGTNLQSVRSATTLAAPQGQGRGPLDPPWLSLSVEPRRHACRLFFFRRDLRTARLSLLNNHEQGQHPEPRTVAGSRVEARMERNLEGMGRLFGDNIEVHPR